MVIILKIEGLVDNLGGFKDKSNLKDLNTGKYLFGQFFFNVNNFTNCLYNYGFKDDK